MIWIKDMWYYFLDDVKYGYINCLNDDIIESDNPFNMVPDYVIVIPKVFSRIGLLRDYIRGLCYDEKLKKIEQKLSDIQLQDLYHGKYASYYDENNEYSKWVIYGKKIIFEYAEKWCCEHSFVYSKKDFDINSKLTYLDCL